MFGDTIGLGNLGAEVIPPISDNLAVHLNAKDATSTANFSSGTNAANTQWVCEEEIMKVMKKAKDIVPETSNLVFMGGVALNCVANEKIAKDWDDIWIMPNPGDAGSSLGAILAGTRQHVNWEGPYLGTNIARGYQLEEVLSHLENGHLVGIAQGRAEFGPRALGNRSLLADPRGEHIKEKVNRIKRRQEFRHFAPIILEENVQDYFMMPVKTSPYMQYVVNSPHKDIPAVKHVDGTSRVQTVNKTQNPHIYTLLKAWKQRTGCPLLLNTSLNIKGQPMVNTWEDAIEFEKKSQVKVF